jgi:16S rRNA (guanine527-N7)-methyltransferase
LLADKFKKFAASLPKVTDREVSLYAAHFEILKKWNEMMGLVSRKSIGQSFENHYADSLIISDFAATHCPSQEVFDLGSGAGFPGIIFAIRYPDRHITLFEKMLKKQSFLAAAITQLDIKNITLSGAMPEEKRTGLFLGRAVMPRDEFFPFLEKRMTSGSMIVSNLGGSALPFPPSQKFKLIAEKKYTLPENAGDRRIEIHQFVSRGM